MIGKKLRSAGACLMAALMMATVFAVSACGDESANVPPTTYTLTYASASVAGGTVSGTPVSGSAVAEGSSVVLTATANEGYLFKGWYENSDVVSTDASYSFSMPAKNYTLSAVFEEEITSYIFTYESADEAMGTAESSVRSGAKQKTGAALSVKATANEGFDFLGWFEGETSVSSAAEYSFSMPAKDYALTAKFAPTPIPTHIVRYSSKDTALGRVVGYANDELFTSGTALEEGTQISLEANPASGQAFAGWFNADDNSPVSNDSPYSFTLGTEDVNLVADFIEDICALHIELDNEDAGSFEIEIDGKQVQNHSVVTPNAAVTLKAIPTPIETDFHVTSAPQDGYVFTGWYTDDDVLKSIESEYSFRMPTGSYTLHAKFVKAYTYTAPKPTDDWAHITLGSYPQTLKADNVAIVSSTPVNGYYTGDDGAKYVLLTATPEERLGSVRTFPSTGNTIEAGKSYYFKVEPLRWRVLTQQDGKAFLMCDTALDMMPFQSHVDVQSDASYVNYYGAPAGTYYANDYQFSEIRYWLNHEFLNAAFSSLPLGVLAKFGVDNSAPSILQMDGVSYPCNNTKDYIALLSFDEVTNTDYGFRFGPSEFLTPDSTKRVHASDYTVARGAFYFDGEYEYCAQYWLRTAGSTDAYSIGYVESEQVLLVTSTGTAGRNDGVYKTDRSGARECAVVPALWLETVAINDGLSLYNPYDLDFPDSDPAADFDPNAASLLKAEFAAALPAGKQI